MTNKNDIYEELMIIERDKFIYSKNDTIEKYYQKKQFEEIYTSHITYTLNIPEKINLTKAAKYIELNVNNLVGIHYKHYTKKKIKTRFINDEIYEDYYDDLSKIYGGLSLIIQLEINKIITYYHIYIDYHITRHVVTIYNVSNKHYKIMKATKNNLLINIIIDKLINILKPYSKSKIEIEDLKVEQCHIKINQNATLKYHFLMDKINDFPSKYVLNIDWNKNSTAFNIMTNIKNDYLLNLKIVITDYNRIYIKHATHYNNFFIVYKQIKKFLKTISFYV